MVELGNMRSPRDAATMTAAAGRERYARALAMAAERYLAAGWRPAEARPTTAARAGERLEHARAAADHVRE
jgi:hypothetical protein